MILVLLVVTVMTVIGIYLLNNVGTLSLIHILARTREISSRI